MLAEVLILQGAPRSPGYPPILTYRVASALAAEIVPGQLVAVPFGERVVAGIVWALDAADDVPSHLCTTPTGEALPHAVARSAGEPPSRLREISALLLPEPVVLAPQRALAEWIADYYAAPLGAAARLFLPPGLLPAVRLVLRPLAQLSMDGDALAQAGGAELDDAAIVLAMARERGRLDPEQVVRALGEPRARTAIRALRRRRCITLAMELPEAYTRTRTERRARLVAPYALLADWQAHARLALDDSQKVPSRAGARARGQAEWLLRQLAVLEVLSRAPAGPGAHDNGSWRLEHLRRLTRATDAALSELEAAGLIAIEESQVRTDPLAGRSIPRTAPLPLTNEQATAVAAITAAIGDEARRPPAFLLHGITGSGKTEVYLQALAAALTCGQRAIVLVPEIALTPQAMARYAGRFPGKVALLHSGLTDGERLDEWRRIRAGEVDIVLGSRSALFAPVERLGLIVVDEEHEAAYKQDQDADVLRPRHGGAAGGAGGSGRRARQRDALHRVVLAGNAR